MGKNWRNKKKYIIIIMNSNNYFKIEINVPNHFEHLGISTTSIQYFTWFIFIDNWAGLIDYYWG